MNFAELVRIAVGLLDAAGVPYMVTGSLASTYHGEPRATRDVDVVIDPDGPALERLVAGLLASGFYVDASAARSALADRSQFNAIGPEAAKVDFIIRRERPFSRAEFDRRKPADLFGSAGFVATAEDMIIAKLEWATESDSERQLRDVRGMLDAGGDSLDRPYIERWVSALGVRDSWNRALEEP